jgi:exodeoxyribonuclease V alpha subunit
MPSSSSLLENLSGLVERVTFHNTDNGFCVLRVQVKGKRELLTVVGHVPTITAGEFIQTTGHWIQDRQHGLQFKAQFITVTAPTTLEGIEKYLGSGLIKGIGPIYAKKLVKAFGEDVFQVIEEEPHQLQQVSGIGPLRAEKIIKSWADQKVIRDIMLFLHSHDISTARAVRIYKTYGHEAIQAITENPYRLARDIRGIGFISADSIAEKLGIEKTSLIRVQAGISYALTTAMNDGHCGLPEDLLIRLCQDLLQVSADLIQQALSRELASGEVVQDVIEEKNCIFLSGLAHAEKSIAERILKLQKGVLPWPSLNASSAINWVEEKTQLKLSQSQKQAIEKSLSSKVLIIIGGPGVGKTTLVHSILKILEAKRLSIALAAPTGRAAKRLSESTGLEAKTLHRLLETNPAEGGFSKNEQSPLSCDLLVVDEMSMVDVPLMHALLKALPPKAALLLVGDVDQLPSVGPGQVLADLIDSHTLPVIRLTEVFRQAAESKIIIAAHAINRGMMPELTITDKESDFYFIDAQDPEVALSKILKLVKDRIPKKFGLSPLSDIQILCPMNRGIIGTRNLNLELQKALNPPTEYSIQRFGWFYSARDKIMQIENDYEKDVYNGDIGIIQKVNTEESEVTIRFDNKNVVYDFGELDEIVLAYATTIHKSQGSEYPAVIIPLMMQHYTMLQRNLIYTAITRGKKLVILVGQKKALAIAIKQKKDPRRWSTLKDKMQKIGTPKD